MDRLIGKKAVITGGTSGIGLATAKLFRAEGAHVVIMGRRKDELEKAVKEIGEHVIPVQGDVSKLEDLDRLFSTIQPYSPIDIVFANAGFTEASTLAHCSPEQFKKLFATNVMGTLFTIQKALPMLKDGGSIILTGSVASVKGSPGFGLYAATKAAVRSFARTFAAELKDRGIRTNVISPGPIDTPLVGDVPPETVKQLLASIPLGRMGKAEEVAQAALFLASAESSFINGIELFCDGGRAQI
jgi:NAD(P)-dependent dehydrogenase (short-subunit alcohol dehydrogenase family)